MIKFGPGGNSESFYKEGHKATIEAPLWLKNRGLDAYEYQCGNGVNVGEESAKAIGIEAQKHGIAMSVHAPYFISLASIEEEKRDKSIKYVLDTLKVAKWMGATRIVVHPGGCSKRDRKEAAALANETMKRIVDTVKLENITGIAICPETMGKINQLGTLEEIIEMCKIDEMLIPTIDFGHLNARTMGGLKTVEDFENIIKHMINELGEERGKNFHSHFSKIEYTSGGEKRHLTFDDNEYGPEFEPLAKAIIKCNATPTIICESAGTMAEDAKKMKDIYESINR
ncbi:MAG: endonuclease IV [Clostridiales bacterium]|nr:endonuclease IV [Clostridiales bacterium]